MAEYLKLRKVHSWGAEAFDKISENISKDECSLKLDAGEICMFCTRLYCLIPIIFIYFLLLLLLLLQLLFLYAKNAGCKFFFCNLQFIKNHY